MSQWHAIVVEGSEPNVRAFVAGFLADRKADASSVHLGADAGVEPTSLGERLRALVGGGHHVVLVADDLAAPLVDALARGGGDVGLRVTGRHAVVRASFAFAAEVFSRDVSKDIRTALGALPAGVHFEEHQENEEAHSRAGGVELYAPEHEYAYRVRGRVAGPLAGVLDLRGRLGAIEAVTLETLHLVQAPA